ncbi:heterokaryon incompatibility protein-domain-containing protein [Stachybotrys elegans]|uniref:Heterokaryon incompatibility protein-domain-containing protein n=1 Tax=Stachybotrys elegans TaxID=80388 RepID=A0A8K0WPR7_9HYPO|nr:heterokaryon incompatibility protein-domain-containing protein [Stachybotrys elegans]
MSPSLRSLSRRRRGKDTSTTEPNSAHQTGSSAVISTNSEQDSPARPSEFTLPRSIMLTQVETLILVEEEFGPWDGVEAAPRSLDGVGRQLDTFKHSPLQGTSHFRILNLQPNSDFDAPIEVQLAEVDRSEKPEYEAVSYSWGDLSDPIAISCNGHPLSVTRNCASALQHLRFRDGTRTLWIDAICIDQTGGAVAERNHQLAIMGSIYEAASTVLIWLGPRVFESNLAMQFLQDFEAISLNDEAKRTSYIRNIYDGELYRRRSRTRSVFGDLAGRSWYERVWTLQEGALARKSLVICGKKNVSWEALLDMMGRLNALESADGRSTGFKEFYDALRIRSSIVSAPSPAGRKSLSASQQMVRNPISVIFAEGLFLRAKMRHDHVFGLYGLLKKFNAHLPEPDYRRPVEQVFAETTRLAIEQDKTLYILGYTNGLYADPGWPSWVPTPLFSFSSDSRCLTVKGKKVARILLKTERSPSFPAPDMSVANDLATKSVLTIESIIKDVKAYHEWIIMMFIFARIAYLANPRRFGSLKDQLFDFARVLLQDFASLPTASDRGEIFSGWNSWLQLLSALNPDSSTPLSQIDAMLSPEDVVATGLPADKRHLVRQPEWRVYSAIQNNQLAAVFHRIVTRSCKAKLFFATETYHLGIAPASIALGDLVVVVSGIETPMVVRPVNDGRGSGRYRLIGPAFVLGMMEGELWPGDEGELNEMTFI